MSTAAAPGPDLDAILYALTRTERRYCHAPGSTALGTNQRAALSFAIDRLRDCLRRGDAIGFDARIDDMLAREPDRADFLLGALYAERAQCCQPPRAEGESGRVTL